jgi:hypothetical protein
MPTRKPQINFQVDPPMKALYEEAKLAGNLVTRFCAAGLLLLIEEPAIRVRALNRLREWEEEYADATPDEVRDFVEGLQTALSPPAPRTPRGRKAPKAKKKAKRSRS